MSSQLLNAKNMIFSVPNNLAALSHTDDKSSAEAPPTPPLSLPISNIASCPVVPVKPIGGFPLLKLARFFRYANVILLLRKLQDSIPFLFKVDAS